jgi:hypothetical protein
MRSICDIRPLTHGPKHHFFGYFNVNAWDCSGRWHLALESDFHDHLPGPGDFAVVGLADRLTGQFVPRGRTGAFNLQQGSMLNWIDAGRGEEFTFNDWDDGRLVAHAVQLHGGERTIDRPIEAVSPTAPRAIGLNFARMAQCRPMVGYASPAAPPPLVPQPADDGLFLIDLAAGTSRLVLSVADVLAAAGWDVPPDQPFWLDHVYHNPSGTRIFFLCRAKMEGRKFLSSLWTAAPDGGDLRCQMKLGTWVSHFAWLDDRRIMLSTDVVPGHAGFVVFHDGEGDFTPVGQGVLPRDGHNALSPDGEWIALDTYPDDGKSELMLYHLERNEKITLGRLDSPKPFRFDIRCDLHPRWSADGRCVTFDSIHEGSRQIYAADVSGIVGR